jgi:tetratricopeptide (TPR) repeat protein
MKIKVKTLAFSLILALISSVTLTAQTKRESDIYDSITYYYYTQNQWDSVIDIGKEALYKGYDFYFLRMRMGLAYDNQGNFRKAEMQYDKALGFLSNDVNAAYFKYFAAINGGREEVAYSSFDHSNFDQQMAIRKALFSDSVFARLPQQTRLTKQISPNFLTLAHASFGYSNTGNQDKLNSLFPQNKNTLLGQAILRDNQSLANLGLAGHFGKYIRWYGAYFHHDIQSAFISQKLNNDLETNTGKISQNEIFFSLEPSLGNGWSVNMNGHALFYKGVYKYSEIEDISYSLPDQQDTILKVNPEFNDFDGNFSDTDYVLGIGLKKKISITDISIFGNYSQIALKNQWQLGGEITLLPLGNYGMYITNRLLYFHEDEGRFIYKVTAGGKLYKKLNFMACATFGDLLHTTEPGVGLVYNWSDHTSYKGDFMLSYPLTKKIYITIHYQITQKSTDYSVYQVSDYTLSSTYQGFYETEYKESIPSYQYNQHFVILGLIWYL